MTKKTETQAVTTKEVAVVEKRLVGQPGVIAIGGTILEPIAQFDNVNGPIVHNDVLLLDYGFGRYTFSKGKLSLYSFTVRKDGQAKAADLFILADELSSLDIEVPGYLDFQDEAFTMITLVNSQSKNDYFRGNVVLVNANTADCAYQDSIIQMQAYFYGESREEITKNPSARRVTLTEVDTLKLTFHGRQLPPGDYYDSDLFENTFVRGELEDDDRVVSVSGSAIRHSSFREGAVRINKSTVTHTGFHFTGDVKLDGVTLENEYFSQIPSIHLASKFDLTLIDVAGKSQARMIRVDKDNVVITLPSASEQYGSNDHKLLTMSFRNPHSRRSLRNKANDVLFGDDMPSEMEESVLDYFVDTVLSRCSMMNLVDSAKRLLSGNLVGVKEPRKPRPMGPMQLSQLDQNNPRVAEIYGTSTSLANEYDNTMYIDGKNFTVKF